MSLNDLHPIAELRRRQSHLFENITRAARPKKIVFYTMDTWQLGLIEQFLHLAFQLKGHEPKTVYYDGLLPITGWENHWVRPTPVEKLKDRADFVFGAFGIPAVGISQYLVESQSQRTAEETVDGVGPAAWREMFYRGIEIGRIALRDLFQYSMGHFEPTTAEAIAEHRRHMIHAVMSVDLAHAIVEKERPDIVVLVNGKLVMYSYMYEVARKLGIQVTTWEEGMYFDTSVVFANNAKAIDFPVEPEIWEELRDVPLDAKAQRDVERYFERWRKQTATWYKYYNNEICDFDRIRKELHLPADDRIVSIFTNIIWDTNALDKDDAFDGMMDWVFTTIDCVAQLSKTTLIVRAHPAEYKCQFKTRTPVRAMIEQRYGGIPSHIRIVDGPSELSSYEIARQSDRCAVYTSTLGIEFTLMGLQPLVCGVPFYGRRGFTNDVGSKEDYARLLSGEFTPQCADPEMLTRYMHMVIFGLVKRPEFFVGIHGSPQQPVVRLDTFEGFPKSLPQFNQIVESILSRCSFVNAPREATKLKRNAVRGTKRIVVPDEEYLPSGDADGRLFLVDGEIHRGVTARRADFYRRTLDEPLRTKLIEAGLVPSWPTSFRADEFNFVIRHQRIEPETYPFEWTGEMAKTVAMFFCQFARQCMVLNIGLKDAHGYNILFDFLRRPHFIDLCSLVPLDETRGAIHPEFNRYFLNPLYLMRAGRWSEARNLLNLGGYETGSRRGGADDDEVIPHLVGPQRQAYFESRRIERDLRASGRYSDLLDFYEREVEAIDVSTRESCWSSYYDATTKYPTNVRFASFEPNDSWQPKQRFLHDLLQSSSCQTVLDIGCSAGWFSQLAAKFGKHVIAIDNDDAALAQLYELSENKSLPIVPLFVDFAHMRRLYPETGHKNWRRFQCDIVLACAIIHHLVFKAGMSFAEIVDTLASLTRSLLVLEFLGERDESIRAFRKERNVQWYRLDGLERELRRRFGRIETVPSTEGAERILLVCRNPRTVISPLPHRHQELARV